MNRRDFLLRTGAAAAVTGALLLAGCAEAPVVSVANNLAIVVESSDGIVVSASAQHATDQLRRTLMSRGLVVLMCSRLTEAGSGDLCIVIAGAASPLVRELGVVVPDAPGSLAIAPGRLDGREVLLASGRDEAGLVQALNEIREAVARAENPAAALRPARAREPSIPFGTPVPSPSKGVPGPGAK